MKSFNSGLPSFFVPFLLFAMWSAPFSLLYAQQFQLVGNATSQGGDCYQLTPNQQSQSGAIWNLSQVNLNQPFDIYAEIYLGNSNGGADGMAFVLQQVSTNQGVSGGGLGYQGISPSLAVQFDTYQNSNQGDPAPDHMSVMRNGSVDHTSLDNLAGPVSMLANNGNTEDGQFHQVRFTWNPTNQVFQAYFDCALRLTYTGNIVLDIFGNNPNVFWGFTAATGALFNEHQVCLEYVSFLQGLQDTSICLGDTLPLDAGPGTAYQWSPTTGLSNDTIANPLVFADTTTFYQVTVTDSCGDQRIDSIRVQVDTCPPIVSVNRLGCYEVQYIVTPASGIAPFSYIWSGSGGLSGTTDTVVINYGGPGTYTYSVTVTDNVFNLSQTLTDTIRLQSLAFANAGPDQNVCSRQPAPLGTVAQPGLSYSWQSFPPNLGLPGGTANQQAQVQVSLTNTSASNQTVCFELTAVDTGGCVALDTACVTFLPEPPNTFVMDDTVCLGALANMAYTGPNVPGMTFNWNFGTGRDAGGANTSTLQGPHQVSWASPLTGLQQVTLTTTLGGCNSPVVRDTIRVLPPPSSRFTAISPVCQGQSTILTYLGSASPNATVIWDLAGGTQTGGTGLGPLNVSWNTPGQKIIRLTVSDFGCNGATFTDTVNVFPLPTAALSNPGPVCVGDSAQFVYTGNASASAFYSWNFDGGSTASANPGQGPVRVAWGTPGPKTVSVSVQENGCFSNLAQVTIQVRPTPTAQIGPIADQCFTGNSFDFSYTGSSGNYTYDWRFGGSANPPTSTLSNPTGVTFSTTGVKTATLRVAENGCISDPASVIFEVIPEPSAAFLFNSPGGTVCSRDTVTFTAIGQPVGPSQTFFWNFGQDAIPATSSLPNPRPVFYTSGGFKAIRLTVDYRGCTDDTLFSFRVEESPILSAGLDKAYCEGDGGAQLDATTMGGLMPYTYQWSCNSGGCGINNATLEDPFVNPLANAPDTVIYFAQVTDARGCKSNRDQVRVLIHAKPKVNAGPDDTLCAQGPGVTLRGGLDVTNRAPGPFSWQWTDSAGNVPPPGILPPNDKFPIAYTRPPKTTIYVLVVTDLSTGCSSAPTTVNPLSTAVVLVRDSLFAFAGRDTLMCFGDTIRLNGFGRGGGGNLDYSWTPTGTGYFDDPSRPDPRVSPLQTTTYTLVASDAECASPGDQVTVRVENIPTVEAGNNVSVCQGDTASLFGQASGSPLPNSVAYSYQWSPGRGLSDPFSQSPTAAPDTTTRYLITATSNQGCGSARDSMTVTVKSTPIPDITNLDTLICIGDEVVLKATHGFDGTVAASPVVYRWSPASAIVGSNFGPVVRAKPTESTVFTVETIYAGCSATDQVVVTVSPQPQAAIQTSDSVICAGEMVDLLGIGGFGNSQYNWSPGLSLSDSTIQDPLATPDSTTTYLLTIEEGACTSEASLTIKVFPQPQADFLFSQPNGCEGLEVSFLAVSENALSYIWDFGDGTPPNNESNPLHTYDQAGEYPVTLTVVGAGGCESTASLVTVKVGESSFADFTSEPVPGSQLTLPDALVTFLDQSLNPTSWIWDFGDGQSSAQQNPIHSYLRAGQYNVTLTVTDSNGCVSAITYGPYEIFEPDLFIPNVFSPNGDGINDRFEVVYTGTETYYLEVFDRWGKVYFTSSSPDSLWDGSLPGGIAANEGVYYYVITIGDNVHKGNVSLLR